MSEDRYRLAEIAQLCSKRNLQTNDGGNLSIRLDDNTMLIKASNVSFSTCVPDDFVLTDLDGNPVCKGKKPSKECKMHGFIYRQRPDIHAIVHCHSVWATAWASTNMDLPESTYHSSYKLKGIVPVFDSHSYYIAESYFYNIGKLFTDQPEVLAFIFKGHGQFALGHDLTHAFYNAELVEETAHIAVLSKLLNSKT